MSLRDFRKRLSKQDYRVVTALWVAGILLAMSIPVPNVGTIDPSVGLDKVIHATLFAGLGLLGVRTLRGTMAGAPDTTLRRRLLIVVVVGSVFAAATEVYQHALLPGRSGDPYDFIADLVGLALAVLAYPWVRTFLPRRDGQAASREM